MLNINLPISKSFANRLLVLQALHRDPLMEVLQDAPEDVKLMHDALYKLRYSEMPLTLDLHNCGTAMRFLTAYCAATPGCDVTLTGEQRMKQRPIGQLVEVLYRAGAEIEYLEKDEYPPLHITGKKLGETACTLNMPLSSQFVSALMLIGLKVETDSTSPYINITRACVEGYESMCNRPVEKDWSAAAFWYEWVALHPEADAVCMQGLHLDSMQGDRRVADIFASLGVETTEDEEGIKIRRSGEHASSLQVDFEQTPDLYPAVAMTCHKLHVALQASGIRSLRLKESDRIEAMNDIFNGKISARHDHRIAMALMAADMPTDDMKCIRKSYPKFVPQLGFATRSILMKNR